MQVYGMRQVTYLNPALTLQTLYRLHVFPMFAGSDTFLLNSLEF